MSEQVKVSAATWRVVEAARVALVAMPAHRDSVLRVARIEQTLVPAIEAFIPASEALFSMNARRKTAQPLRAAHLEELHMRTLYWLTYVRLDLPGYEASNMGSRKNSAKVAIDRARRVLTLLRLDAEPRDFAEALIAELSPLYDRAMRERSDAEAMTLARAQLQARARELMAPVHRDIATLRRLLRNELGAAHPHVRGLIMVAPKKPRPGAAIDRTSRTSVNAPTPESAEPVAAE